MEINKDTKAKDVISTYREFEKRLMSSLVGACRKVVADNMLSDVIKDIEVCKRNDDDCPFLINYIECLGEISFKKSLGIKYDESLKHNLDIIIKNVKYDLKLIDEYPDEFKLWSFMHTHENDNNHYHFCDLIKWPNTTTTSYGGGSYDVERIKSVYAPRYLDRLNESIASHSEILSKLLNYKKEFETLFKEMEAKDDKRRD